MSIRHNSKGIDPNPSFPTLPENEWFEFKITEAIESTSKKGYDLVKLKAEVINNEEWKGTTLFHYVTFIPKGQPGDGISVHFRKCVGLPYGGDDVIDDVDWLGKKFKAKTIVEEYDGKKNSKIKVVDSLVPGADEDVPF